MIHQITQPIYHLHREDLNRIALSNFYTRHFPLSGHSNEKNYGVIRVALEHNKPLGFVVFWHRKRKHPLYTDIHFLAVDEKRRSQGIGKALLDWVKGDTPFGEIRLRCDIANPDSVRFWLREGFSIISSNKKYHLMCWKDPNWQSLESFLT